MAKDVWNLNNSDQVYLVKQSLRTAAGLGESGLAAVLNLDRNCHEK